MLSKRIVPRLPYITGAISASISADFVISSGRKEFWIYVKEENEKEIGQLFEGGEEDINILKKDAENLQ